MALTAHAHSAPEHGTSLYRASQPPAPHCTGNPASSTSSNLFTVNRMLLEDFLAYFITYSEIDIINLKVYIVNFKIVISLKNASALWNF